MPIRPYTPADKDACMAIFRSNCPHYFDPSEEAPFEQWLEHQAAKTRVFENSEEEHYYVLETPEHGIAACGGFYLVKGAKEARLAWGMVHSDHHRKGYGTELYEFRRNEILKNWPDHVITLGTSQHTWPFYEKMGMRVTDVKPAGYGPHLDRYDMEL